MKKSIIITIVTILIVLGFITGTYFYKIHSLDKAIASSLSNQSINNTVNVAVSTSANTSEIKISPECKLDFKTLYTVCNHTIETSEQVSNDLVNLGEDECKAKYPDWQIQNFTSDKIDLYREVNDYCHQHYMLKDDNGYIGIYNLDQNDNVTGLNKMTDISTEYLTDTDVLGLQKGIRVYTDVNLNKMLEDFQ